MKTKIFILLISIPVLLSAQNGNRKFFVSANYIYTATSKLYLQPNSSDPILRGTHYDLDDVFSYSGEIGYRIFEDVVLAVGIEYVEKTHINNDMIIGGERITMTDGYKVYPIEFTVYYILPFSTEDFKFFMAGGGGVYYGSHIRNLADISASTESLDIGYGIHAAAGIDYYFEDYIAIRGQMRFRDPEFSMKNKYSNDFLNYEGNKIYLTDTTFDSKVNIDGISFMIGILFNF